MTRQNRTLMLQFAFATAICIVIGVFVYPLIGLVGFGVCAVIFAVNLLSRRPVSDPTVASLSQTNATTSGDHVVYAQAPHCYLPGNPVYYPPEGERGPDGT